MFSIFKKNEKVLTCPVTGQIIPIKNVHDPVFAEEMMGTGFAIIPMKGSIVSPVDGEITVVFPTGHAYGIRSHSGLDLIIHVGVDTVTLNGEGFEILCKQDQEVKVGDKLVNVDLQKMKDLEKDSTCIIVFPNRETVKVKNPYSIVNQGDKKIVEIV